MARLRNTSFLINTMFLLVIYLSFLLGRQYKDVENIKWIFYPPTFDTPIGENRLKPNLILNLINENRNKKDLDPFIRNEQLEYVSYLRANHIVNTKEFSHLTSNNSSYDELIRKFVYRFSRYGENLGVGYADEKRLVNDWMLSQPHRELILGDYTDAGIYTSEEYSVLIVGKQ